MESLNIALPKGRLGEKVLGIFEEAGFPCPSIHEESRKLIFENKDAGVRYFWVKPSDVAIYVERGAADTDLFILDAQYTDEEYERCRGFGHPGMRTSAQIIAASGAGKGLLFHHAPMHTDEQLGTYERQLQQFQKNISFAREGDRITL